MSARPERRVDDRVAVVGAGPYGLAVAAGLRQRDIGFRIFGTPMQAWQDAMPRGMFLKSEGFASDIADPARALTLARFCAESGLEYGDYGVPVPVDTFIRYGHWFREAAVGVVEDASVQHVTASGGRFELTLDTGERATAERVVVASGLNGFAFVPRALRELPPDLRTHSSEHHDLTGFRGKRVVVVGGGQSALESAALLHEHGAEPKVIVRAEEVAWNPTPAIERSTKRRLRYPRSGLGDGWDLWTYSNVPLAFHALGEKRRAQIVWRTLGPAGSWWLRDRLDGQVDILRGSRIEEATAEDGSVRLRVSRNGRVDELEADHVLAATGYRPDVDRVPFLDPALRARIARGPAGPSLSRWFESSAPGLYFVGLAAATSFGPPQRFVLGSGFAARRVTTHVARSQRSRLGR
jgi:cation diffusion facilitator CzcD-associated flavoprotein CzcO